MGFEALTVNRQSPLHWQQQWQQQPLGCQAHIPAAAEGTAVSNRGLIPCCLQFSTGAADRAMLLAPLQPDGPQWNHAGSNDCLWQWGLARLYLRHTLRQYGTCSICWRSLLHFISLCCINVASIIVLLLPLLKITLYKYKNKYCALAALSATADCSPSPLCL